MFESGKNLKQDTNLLLPYVMVQSVICLKSCVDFGGRTTAGQGLRQEQHRDGGRELHI